MAKADLSRHLESSLPRGSTQQSVLNFILRSVTAMASFAGVLFRAFRGFLILTLKTGPSGQSARYWTGRETGQAFSALDGQGKEAPDPGNTAPFFLNIDYAPC